MCLLLSNQTSEHSKQCSSSFDFNEQNEGVKTFKAKEIKFISPEGLVADTDGELYQKTPSNIKVVEKRFKFLSKPLEQ